MEPALADQQLAAYGAGAVDTTDPERRYRDLFDARSVIGAIAVLAVLSFFGFGLRAIDESQKSAGFEAGSRYQLKAVSFAPVDGWSIDQENTISNAVVTITNNGVTTKLQPLAMKPNDTVEGLAKQFYEGDAKSDKFHHVTEFEPFTTSTGAHGVTWSATGPTDATQSWVVGEGGGTTTAWMVVDGPVSTWKSVQGDLDAMAASISVKAASKEQSP